jgi:predicted CxxxxCH...CXXCH cytochrome family protein
MLQMGFSGGTGGEIYNGRVLQSPYVYDATNGTTVATNGTMTCSNIYCHSNGTSVATGTIPAVTSPSWDTTGPLACNTCHGYPPAYAQDQPKSNTHSRHQSFSCSTCHYATTSNGTQITGIANHANGEYDVIKDPNATYLGNPVTFSYQFDPGGGKCSNVICHGPGNNYMVWGGVELIAGIGWSAGPACNEIRFTGQLNGTPPETFSWNFGDGQTGQGENITHYYAQPGAYQVQLYAIDTNRHSDTVSVPVVAQRVNVPPVPDFTVTVSGLTVTVTDYSTDPDYNTCDHTGPGNILVRWGESGVPDTVVSADLTATRPTVGRTISHTYSTGGNYTLKHGVKDNDPDSSYVYSGNIPVTINSSFSISGKVVRADGITPVATASMRLNGGPSVKLTTTNSSGNYIFTSVSPGSYTVQASKSGLIFVDKPVVVTNASVTGVNFTADR